MADLWPPGGYPVTFTTPPTSLSENSTATPDVTRTSTPYREAWICHEIDFLLQLANISAHNRNLGGTVSCKFNIGAIDLTRNFVPVWNFGTVLDDSQEALLDVNDVIGGGAAANFNTYRWFLPRPLLIEPGAAILPTLQRSADGLGGSIVATVSMHGRVLPHGFKLPRKVWVPYVSAYVQPQGQASGRNNELDFKNIYETPLEVQRFIGRIQSSSAGIITDFTSNDLPTNANIVQVKLMRGFRDLIKGFAPFYNVFNVVDRAWTFGGVLEPQEHFDWQIVGVSTNLSPMISMICSREVKL